MIWQLATSSGMALGITLWELRIQAFHNLAAGMVDTFSSVKLPETIFDEWSLQNKLRERVVEGDEDGRMVMTLSSNAGEDGTYRLI